MTQHEYMVIARVIRKLPRDLLLIAHRFAAMLAKDDPHFDRTGFLAAAPWGIERQADGAAAAPDCRTRT